VVVVVVVVVVAVSFLERPSLIIWRKVCAVISTQDLFWCTVIQFYYWVQFSQVFNVSVQQFNKRIFYSRCR
jgi:hypothetical protein